MGETWKVSEENKSGNPEIDAALADVILGYIGQFATLTPTETDAILSQIQVKHYPKGSILLREGQISATSHFVLKGCIRQYYLVDGIEKTVHFYTEGEPVTANEGASSKLPSKYYLSCVEDCILSIGKQEEEAAMHSRFPKFEAVCRVATEEELARSQDKLASFIINTPEERYLHLLQTRPDLVDRVPQYHLASFLGITPESLSRIRKRIMSRKHSI